MDIRFNISDELLAEHGDRINEWVHGLQRAEPHERGTLRFLDLQLISPVMAKFEPTAEIVDDKDDVVLKIHLKATFQRSFEGDRWMEVNYAGDGDKAAAEAWSERVREAAGK